MNSSIVLACSLEERQDRLSADFQDNTGDWSPANPGGYGSPNPASADAFEARISVTPQGYTAPVVFTITLAAGVATSYTVTDVNGNVGSPVTISKAFPFTSADPFNM